MENGENLGRLADVATGKPYEVARRRSLVERINQLRVHGKHEDVEKEDLETALEGQMAHFQQEAARLPESKRAVDPRASADDGGETGGERERERKQDPKLVVPSSGKVASPAPPPQVTVYPWFVLEYGYRQTPIDVC